MDKFNLKEIMDQLHDNGCYNPKEGDEEIIDYLEKRSLIEVIRGEFEDFPIQVKPTKGFRYAYLSFKEDRH